MTKKPHLELPSFENRKARHDYAIEDSLEVGIALRGSEAKSVRLGLVNLADGFVRCQDSPPAFLLYNVHIGAYQPAGTLGHKPVRPRLLLAHKREVLKWAKRVDAKGMTIVPLKLYFKGPWVKVLIGLGKGKHAHDKRRSIADRDNRRELDRAMSKPRRP